MQAPDRIGRDRYFQRVAAAAPGPCNRRPERGHTQTGKVKHIPNMTHDFKTFPLEPGHAGSAESARRRRVAWARPAARLGGRRGPGL